MSSTVARMKNAVQSAPIGAKASGPRAEQVPFVAVFREQIPFYEHRHLVRPGVTGWAQVNYGYADDEADTVEKLTYDLYYIKHMSPVMDIRVLWQSLWTVLTGAGAR